MRWLTGTVLAIAIVVALSGCGGGSTSVQPPSPTPSPTPPVGSVTITITSLSPSSATAGSLDLTLAIDGTNLDLTHTGSPQDIHTFAIWSVNGSQTSLNATVVSGTQVTAVLPSALLAAPVTAQISVQKWYKADDTPFAVSNSSVFTVTSSATPSVVPATDTLRISGMRQFAAADFDDNSKVDWTVEEGSDGGTITPNGLYTAPDHVGTFHIIAQSSSAPGSTASSLVTVTSSGFTSIGTMNVARTGHTATLLKDGKVLIVGGGDATAELYDPASGTFSFTGPPLEGRLHATATMLSDGRVLIAGGLGLTAGPDGHLPLLNTAEIFDPVTGTFSSTGSMAHARQQHTATLEGGQVLVAGGYFDNICFTASAELFEPATGTFSPTGFMLSERVGHTATLLASGEVLVVGGSNGCAPDSSDDPPWDPLFAELYEPNSGSFQESGNMSTTRIHHAAVRLDNGKVLALGGIPPAQNLHEQPPNPSYAELYDPVTRAFSPIAGLTISHERYTATLLPSGMVLIVGGEDTARTPTTEAQLLDSGSGLLSPTGALGKARVGHTATLLQDGSVLVTGGTDARGSAIATAELFK